MVREGTNHGMGLGGQEHFHADSKLDAGAKAFVEPVFGYAALLVKPKK